MSEDVNGGGGEGSVRQSRHQTTWCQPEKKLRIKKKIIYFSAHKEETSTKRWPTKTPSEKN